MVVGLISTTNAIVCAVKSKSVPVGANGSVVEDTTDKLGKFCRCVKMLAPSPPIHIGGLEFLASTVVEVQKASTAVERTGVE
jgi:N-acetyl-beta-hexosaminidase